MTQCYCGPGGVVLTLEECRDMQHLITLSPNAFRAPILRKLNRYLEEKDGERFTLEQGQALHRKVINANV